MPTETSPAGHTEVAKRTRVLLITARADHGGGPRHIFDLLRSFQNSDFDFYIAAPHQDPYFSKFKALSRAAIQIPARSFSVAAFFRLRRFVKENGIQLVHSHGRGAGIYSRLLSLTSGFANTGIVHSFHGIHSEPSLKGRLKLFVDRVLAYAPFTPLFVSESEQSEALRTGSVRDLGGKLSVIENVVDGSRFRKRQYLAFENPKALHAGSLMRPDHAKGPELFLALTKLADLKWSCAGVSSAELEPYGEVTPSLETVGRVAEPAEWLSSIDVYVSTSRSEGMPLGVLEAMNAGCICVLSDIPAHRSFAKAGAALLFAAMKPDSFSAQIARLKTDANLRASLLEKSKALLNSNHSLAAFRAKLESVYRSAALAAQPGCPMCGNAQTQKRSMFFRYEGETSVVFQCTNCETAFLSPQPSPSWLTHEYSGYYNRRSSGVQKLEHFRRFFKSHNPVRFRRVLEVGGGEGACARALLEASPQASLTVVEAHADAAKYYSEIPCTLIGETLENWLEKNREKFELIIMFDVLEHVRDPRMILDRLAQCLEPGGEIWLSVPNYDSVSRKLLGKIWPQYKPEHLFYFSQKGLRSACKQSGLGSVQINRHLKYLPVSYLFNVGAGFGPKIIQQVFGVLKSVVPGFVQRKAITFCLGERLITARREAIQAVPR